MIKTVKIQQNKASTYINIPKELKEELKFDKGDTVILEVKDGNLIIKK